MTDNKPDNPEWSYWGEHPDYPSKDWRYEVANGDTREGYWEWCRERITQAKSEKPG